MTSARILLVEDEPALLLTLTDRLMSEGYQVESSADGQEGYERAVRGGHDLIVLDLMLPGKDGLQICQELRRQGIQTPILMLTARGQLVDKVLGLKLGADDYMTKPFEALELLARVEVLLRRSRAIQSNAAGSYGFGDIRVDFASSEVRKGSESLELSALEYRLLCHLIENRGRVLSRDELLDEVWGYDATPMTRTVDVHISSLRQKLEPVPAHPQWIRTIRGRGYRFDG